jgi:Xaa-Pro aminopeptidase
MESIPAEFQWIGGAAFAIAVAVFAAWSRVTGKKEGPPQPKVQEFYAAGQLADMGPVKELVEAAGLVFQQQVRTNIHLEASAKAQQTAAEALTKFAEAYEHRIEDEQREKEIADEVDRRLRQQQTPK